MDGETDDGRMAREDGDALPCMGSMVTVLVGGERTGGRFALMESVERAGCWQPLHMHSREDEVVHVLEGRVRFWLDDAWIERGAGETLLLPRGREHAHAVASEAARLLVLAIPAGLEGYYRELGQPVRGPCVYQEAERLVIVAARYGVVITGPPPADDASGRSDGSSHPNAARLT